MRHPPSRLAKDRRGTTAIEYGVIAAFIAVSLVAALPSLRQDIIAWFGTADTPIAAGDYYPS
jgi:pilus assembly protein Flp/PilA